MKVTINSDGSVSFEVESAADALSLARELQNGSAASTPVAEPAPKRPKSAVKPKTVEEAANTAGSLWDDVETKSKSKQPSKELLNTARSAGLTVASYVVWEYLVNHEDDRRGVSIAEIARHFHLTNAAAGQRLLVLHKAGFCVRVKQGRYKAATP